MPRQVAIAVLILAMAGLRPAAAIEFNPSLTPQPGTPNLVTNPSGFVGVPGPNANPIGWTPLPPPVNKPPACPACTEAAPAQQEPAGGPAAGH